MYADSQGMTIAMTIAERGIHGACITGPEKLAKAVVQWLSNLLSTSPLSREHSASIVRHQGMKVITHKQMKLAIEHLAELLKRDGASQTLTVQEWLDAAQFHPAEFQSSLPALEILGLLGFGDELVRPATLG